MYFFRSVFNALNDLKCRINFTFIKVTLLVALILGFWYLIKKGNYGRADEAECRVISNPETLYLDLKLCLFQGNLPIILHFSHVAGAVFNHIPCCLYKM